MATPSGLSRRHLPIPVSTATGRYRQRPTLLGSRSRYYALLNQSCHCYCWLRGVSPFPFSFVVPALVPFAIPLSCVSRLLTVNRWVGGSETQATAPFGVPMNFINKTTLARCAARSYKAQTDRPVQLLLYVSPRGRRAWRICTFQVFPLSLRIPSRRKGKYQPSAFLKRDVRRCRRFVVMGIPLYSDFKNSIVARARALGSLYSPITPSWKFKTFTLRREELCR